MSSPNLTSQHITHSILSGTLSSTLSGTLSDYQRAILQAMHIPMYAMREGFELPQQRVADAKLTNEPHFQAKSDALQGDAISRSQQRDTNNSAAEKMATSPAASKLIDETDTFIIQVLAFFEVSSIAELDITWQVHNADTIVFANKVLSTPHPETFTSAVLKKQLWQSMQVLFKGDQWS